MEPLEFAGSVLPSVGHYCVVELTSNKKEKVMSPTIEGLRPKFDEFNNKGYDTYFSTVSFQDGESRVAQNALFKRCFYVDIDCKHPKDLVETDKPYANAKAAAVDLQRFLIDSGLGLLGNPWIVHSGSGLHVYWPFASDVPIEKWKPVAENFKRICLQYGLKIDVGVTADIARVLRMPGTTNTGVKGGKRVRGATKTRVLAQGDIFEYEDIRKFCANKLNGSAAPVPDSSILVEGARPEFADSGLTIPSGRDDLTSSFKLIMQKTSAGKGCAQLGWYLENGHKDGMEEIWRGWLTIAHCCTDGEKAKVMLSKVHGYDEKRTEIKWRDIEQKGGPYPCSKFDSVNPNICTGCVHSGTLSKKGKAWSPIMLCNTPKLDNSPKEAVVEFEGRRAKALIKRPDPPYGFSYGSSGGIFCEKEEDDKWGNTHKSTTQVLAYELFPAYIVKEHDEHIVLFAVRRPEGMTFVRIPQRACVSKDETLKHLAAQNIVCSSFAGAAGDINLYTYIRGCLAKISMERGPVVAPDNFGWQNDDTFVLGELRYEKGVDPSYIPMNSMENILRSTKVEGSLDGWRAVIKMMIRNEQYGPLAFLTVGFGSPLMRFSGCSGMTFHAGGRFSGTGKTTGLDLAASIWGHPRDFRVGSGTSDVALIQRAGLLRSLPLISDEITHKQRTTPEWIPGFIFGYSDGKGKDRLESGANKERLNLTTWESLAALSSNTYIMDYLSGSRAHSSHGEIYRMLEWLPTKEMRLSEEDIEILKSLKFNYGWAGEVFARWLVDHMDIARAVYKEVEARVKKEIDYKDGERFWLAGVTSSVTAAILIGEKYADIIDLPVARILAFFKELISQGRLAERSGHRTAEDVLNEYTREFYGNMIILKEHAITVGEDRMADHSLTHSKVMGRIEHDTEQGFIDYYISEKELKAFCTSRSFGYADFKKQIATICRLSEVKKNLLQGVVGPPMRVAALKITRRSTGENDDVAK